MRGLFGAFCGKNSRPSGESRTVTVSRRHRRVGSRKVAFSSRSSLCIIPLAEVRCRPARGFGLFRPSGIRPPIQAMTSFIDNSRHVSVGTRNCANLRKMTCSAPMIFSTPPSLGKQTLEYLSGLLTTGDYFYD